MHIKVGKSQPSKTSTTICLIITYYSLYSIVSWQVITSTSNLIFKQKRVFANDSWGSWRYSYCSPTTNNDTIERNDSSFTCHISSQNYSQNYSHLIEPSEEEVKSSSSRHSAHFQRQNNVCYNILSDNNLKLHIIWDWQVINCASLRNFRVNL